jgi:chromosome segregation ATPase
MARLGVAPHVVEAVLNHKSGQVRGDEPTKEIAAERRVTVVRWSQVTAAIAGLLGAVSMTGGALLIRHAAPEAPVGRSVELEIEQRITQIEDDFGKLSTELKNVHDSLKDISNLPKDAKLSFQLQQIQKTVANIQGRQDQLEQVIVTSPSKALEMPLFKRDLENLKDAQKAEALTFKEDIDRVYDLNKWLFGTIGLGIITLAISTFLKSWVTDKTPSDLPGS